METQSNHDPRCMGCPQCDDAWKDRKRKRAICEALRAFMEQRPGFDGNNYSTMRDYRQDQRRAQRQLHDARELLRAVEGCDDISADALLRAAESGRLSIKVRHFDVGSGKLCANPLHEVHCEDGKNERITIDYCAGQYWCTEFRAGVCRVLSSALWDCERENMPAAHMLKDGERVYMMDQTAIPRLSRCVSAGDYLRNTFRQRFGKSLAARWFN